ncbi:alpha/beta hydrolase [Amycolatopsis sp., V23-08]|uniref:Alpha/beta hydrolase n=1 Tax=Amycolatopsis heterodermiae TaxID=3110235 RepID=A0ABU5RA19_9PSEU|nr:alpha/beta hydrolase [Amycolatopsis sp., V23-08]MEA5362479.1 alpha/beta hydrolase [Amycolatopsis sp., V23-08]
MKKLLLAAAIAAVAATALAPSASAAPSPPDPLKWGSCPAAAYPTPDLQCTTLKVPLDYRDPDGRKIDILVSRMPSKHPEKRRGVLLTNPGGPGVAGWDFPQYLTLPGLPAPLPQSVRDAYDVIGFDPRGVGHSTPVTCDLTPEQQAIGNLPYPKDAADVVKQAKVAKAEAEQCANAKTGWMLPHVTTANTARDMDRIREALGESKLSYSGASYGTYLGAVYTTLFPRRSDRIVLDSNLGPDGYDVEAMRGFGRGLEDRFPDFAKFAAAHQEYGLGTTPAQVTAKFFELAARLDRTPVGAFDGGTFRGLNFGYSYGDSSFEALAAAWQSLDKGEVPKLYDEHVAENGFAARFAVVCGDSVWPKSVATYQRNVAVDRIRHPMVGAGAANISACAYWQAPAAEPKVRITGNGPSNVLMVQNQRDPGTPLVNARKLRAAFGDRARMVTVDQGGHGSFVVAPNQCGNNAVTAFLVSGERPAHDAFCAAETP